MFLCKKTFSVPNVLARIVVSTAKIQWNPEIYKVPGDPVCIPYKSHAEDMPRFQNLTLSTWQVAAKILQRLRYLPSEVQQKRGQNKRDAGTMFDKVKIHSLFEG